MHQTHKKTISVSLWQKKQQAKSISQWLNTVEIQSQQENCCEQNANLLEGFTSSSYSKLLWISCCKVYTSQVGKSKQYSVDQANKYHNNTRKNTSFSDSLLLHIAWFRFKQIYANDSRSTQL